MGDGYEDRNHLDCAALHRGVLIGVLARVKVSGGEFITSGGFQFKLLSTGSSQVVSLRVEAEGPSKSQGSNNLCKMIEKVNSESEICFKLDSYNPVIRSLL